MCAISGELLDELKERRPTVSLNKGLSDRKAIDRPCTISASNGMSRLGVEIGVEVPPGLDPVDHLDAADLHHAIAAARIEAGCLSIENHFPHEANLSARA